MSFGLTKVYCCAQDMAPSVIYIDQVEQVFQATKKKKGGDANAPSRIMPTVAAGRFLFTQSCKHVHICMGLLYIFYMITSLFYLCTILFHLPTLVFDMEV